MFPALPDDEYLQPTNQPPRKRVVAHVFSIYMRRGYKPKFVEISNELRSSKPSTTTLIWPTIKHDAVVSPVMMIVVHRRNGISFIVDDEDNAAQEL